MGGSKSLVERESLLGEFFHVLAGGVGGCDNPLPLFYQPLFSMKQDEASFLGELRKLES